MPSKKKSQVELLPPEVETRPTRRRVVAAKHTVVYEAPEVVEIPAEDDDEDQAPEIQFDEPEQQPRQPSFKTKLRDKFKAKGIGGDERLILRIDRLPFFDQTGHAGVRSDKEFCGVIPCTEGFFDGEEYLTEILRRYGPGEYWLTVRHKNAIVSSWRERLGGFPVAPVAVTNEPGQPPQIIYQQPGQAPAPVRNLKDELREVSEMIKLVDNIRGPREEGPPLARSEDEVLASAILKQPAIIENVVGSVVKKFGRSGGGDDDPSPWAVAMKLVESGQAAQIVKTLVDSFFNGVNSMIPGRQNNGTQTMAQAPHANMGTVQNPAHPNGQDSQFRQDQNIQALAQSPASAVETGAHAPGQQPSPEQDALALVIHHCKHKIPPKITYAELTQREQRLDLILNQHAMQTGQILTNQITLYLDSFAEMAPAEAIAFVGTLPGGEEIAALPHVNEWTEQLQTIIKDSQEGDEA